MRGRHTETLVRLFDAFKASDLDALLDLVAEDVIFEPDLKGKSFRGKAALRKIWGGFLDIMTAYDYTVLSAVEQGDLAIFERVEVITTTRGGEMRLPIMGIFRFDPDGRITHWRDYWDTSMAPAH